MPAADLSVTSIADTDPSSNGSYLRFMRTSCGAMQHYHDQRKARASQGARPGLPLPLAEGAAPSAPRKGQSRFAPATGPVAGPASMWPSHPERPS